MDVWDEADNIATASREFELLMEVSPVTVSANKKGQDVVIDFQRDNKIPLSYWSLEMWSEKGRLIKKIEGQELPDHVDMELNVDEQDQRIGGVLKISDVLGNKEQQRFTDLFPSRDAEEDVPIKSGTEAWVDDF